MPAVAKVMASDLSALLPAHAAYFESNLSKFFTSLSPLHNAIAAFKAVLDARGLTATVRLTRGRDIDAACGQLAARA